MQSSRVLFYDACPTSAHHRVYVSCDMTTSYIIPYSGNGANFRMNPQHTKIRTTKMLATHMRTMALYRYFKPSGALPDPSGPLSAFVSPSVIRVLVRGRGTSKRTRTFEILKKILKAILSFIRKVTPTKFPAIQ